MRSSQKSGNVAQNMSTRPCCCPRLSWWPRRCTSPPPWRAPALGTARSPRGLHPAAMTGLILMHKCLMVSSPLSLDWSPGRSWPARCSGGHRVVCSWAGQPRDVCWTHFPLLHGDEHPGGDLGPGSHCCIHSGQSPCNTRNMTWHDSGDVSSLGGAWIWVKWCR